MQLSPRFISCANPEAIAITFLRLPPSSTPITSVFVYNLNLFATMLRWEISLDEQEFELSTEWVGMKSKHIVAASGQNSLDFKTSVKIDEKGNITELVVRYQNRENPIKKIKIYYVM